METIDGVYVFGAPDEGALKQAVNCRFMADHVALMADHHKGYAVPIGGVVAYENLISPSGVGYDIGCGNKAVLTDANAQDVLDNIDTIMDDVVRTISFGVGRKNNEDVDHGLFYRDVWKMEPLAGMKNTAREQLGTVGSGNHYVDIFVDEKQRIWVGVHFGSRGLGHKIATHFLRMGGARDSIDEFPLVVPANGILGEDYLQAMTLAGDYAYAGRDWVCNKVVQSILKASVFEEVHNHHNFAWRELHDGKFYWVVRKGSTPAWPGQKCFVGASMGENAVILEGQDSELNQYTLNSTVHGAGRVMSRTAAAGKYNRKTGELLKPGLISRESMELWLNKSGVTLRGGGLDEAPQAYKRLPDVLEAQGDTVKILHTLAPLGVAMAGRDVFDPYKD